MKSVSWVAVFAHHVTLMTTLTETIMEVDGMAPGKTIHLYEQGNCPLACLLGWGLHGSSIGVLWQTAKDPQGLSSP